MPVVKPVERVKGSKGRKVVMLTEMGVKYTLDSNKKVTTKGQGCTI